MAEKKHSELYILKILTMYTDEDHVLSRKEIMNILKKEYGIEMDRRTFYSALHVLQAMSIDISTFEENHAGYYLMSRQFEFAEVMLLCNAIHASPYIPRRASEDLVEKLLSTQSIYQVNDYHDEVYLPNPKKTDNRELLFNVDAISRAIHKRRNIIFQYLTHDMNRKVILKHDGKKYDMNPQFIVYQEGKPYLVAKDPQTEEYRHFRLDRMTGIKTGQRRIRIRIKRRDPYAYVSNRLFMYSGEQIPFTARCERYILDYMIELFGKNLSLTRDGTEYFIMHASSTRQDIIWLAQEYLDAMEILEPADLRDEIRSNLAKSLARYDTEVPDSGKKEE